MASALQIPTETRLAAQLALANLLNCDAPLQEISPHILQTICEHFGWDVGALWDVDEPRAVIRPIDLWHSPDVVAEAAEVVRGVGELDRGVGLPGSVWESGAPHWIVDFARESSFPRAPQAIAAGLRGAMAFPIVNAGRVVGVMEFFSREPRQPNEALLPVMALIGAHIGDYIERRRTAEALRESLARFRVMTESAQDAIFTIDSDSRIRFANSAVERIFGWAPSELVGKLLDVIIPPRLHGAHHAGIARYLGTGQRNIPWSGVELPGLHRDGHEVPVELSFGEFEIEGRPIFSGFARDITERKRAAVEAEVTRAQLERRAEEEMSFRRLASALTGAVEMEDVLNEITSRATLVTRADGVYVERILGEKREVDVVAAFGYGAPPRGMRVAYPGSLTEEILSRRDPIILTDMHGFGASMAPYLVKNCADCELLVTPLIADDHPLGALVLLNSRRSGRRFDQADVTRAKTLGDLTSLALRRVRLMEREREAREKAEAAVRVRDETLGIVSHDLRNPLTTIGLAAELMAEGAPEEQREHIDTIRAAAHQMQRLIQDLLDVARVESGRFSVRKSVVDPASLARQACESQATLAETKELQLSCDVPDDLPPVEADRDRVLQVFANLIGNAVKFTPRGGSVAVRGRLQRDCVVFDVCDSGPGIPESELKNVFKPYWQAKKTAHLGAGLGLAIVRGIVEAHGGTVRAENGAGGGAVFTFTIPLH